METKGPAVIDARAVNSLRVKRSIICSCCKLQPSRNGSFIAANHVPEPAAEEPGKGEPDQPPGEGQVKRKIIYTAALVLIIEDLDESQTELETLVKKHEGFIPGKTARDAALARRRRSETLNGFRFSLRDIAQELGEILSGSQKVG